MATNASGTATAGPIIAPRCFLPGSIWGVGDRLVAVTGAADPEEVETMLLRTVGFWLTTEVTTLALGLFMFDESPLTISDSGIRLGGGADEDEEDTAAGLVEDGDDNCGNIDMGPSSEKREFVVSQHA